MKYIIKINTVSNIEYILLGCINFVFSIGIGSAFCLFGSIVEGW